METSLQRIEKKLKIFPGGRTLLRRFLTVGRVLLEETEYELGVTKADIEGKDFDYRLGRARHTALNKAAAILNVTFHDTDHAIQKSGIYLLLWIALKRGLLFPILRKIFPKKISKEQDSSWIWLILS